MTTNLLPKLEGHYYEAKLVSHITWESAFAEASLLSYRGLQGYLATITSSTENNLIANLYPQGSLWIGASDKDQEGKWFWMAGPEKGTQFWEGTSSGNAINNSYTNWYGLFFDNMGDATTGADYGIIYGSEWVKVVTFHSSEIAAKWGDSSYYPDDTTNVGYAVEYGGLPATYTIASSATSVNEGNSVTFTIDTKNVEWGNTVSYTLTGISQADLASGSLTGTATVNQNGVDGRATVTVNLANDQTTEGNETLTISVSDQQSSVTVQDTSKTPTASVSLAVTEDTKAKGTVTATDVVVDDKLSYSVVTGSGPSLGKVEFADSTSGVYIYTPNPNAFGKDSFILQVSDGNGGADTVRVEVTIAAVNDAPVIGNMVAAGSLAVTEDLKATGSVTATDVDGDTITYGVGSQGKIGTVSVDASTGVYTYAPAADKNGADSFVLTASDGNGGADSITVDVKVAAVNDAPKITADSGSTALATTEDTAKAGLIIATDVDGDSLTYAVASQGKLGTVSIDSATGSYTYTPKANENGSDSFVLSASDGKGGADSITVNVTIAAVNDAPVAADDTATVVGGNSVAVSVLANDKDADNDKLSIISAVPTRGNVTINSDGTLTYKAMDGDGSSTGIPDSVIYTVSDGKGGAASAMLTVNVVTSIGGTSGNDVLGVGTGLSHQFDGKTYDLTVSADTASNLSKLGMMFEVFDHRNGNQNVTSKYLDLSNVGNSTTNNGVAQKIITRQQLSDALSKVLLPNDTLNGNAKLFLNTNGNSTLDTGEVATEQFGIPWKAFPLVTQFFDSNTWDLTIGGAAYKPNLTLGLIVQVLTVNNESVVERYVSLPQGTDTVDPWDGNLLRTVSRTSLANALKNVVQTGEQLNGNAKVFVQNDADAAQDANEIGTGWFGIPFASTLLTQASSSVWSAAAYDGIHNDISITKLASGGYVTVWQGSDGSKSGVFAQRLDRLGGTLGNPLRVNSDTLNEQSFSESQSARQNVAALAGGGFVVVYRSENSIAWNLMVQQYGSDGSPMGAATTIKSVNSEGTNALWIGGDASIAGLSDGGFVVVWMDRETATNSWEIFGQRFTADGTKSGSEFPINQVKTNDQMLPHVSGLSDGGFIVTWRDQMAPRGFGESKVITQRFDAAGASIGGATQANMYDTDVQWSGSTAPLSDGGYWALWQSNGQDGSGWGVYAQRFSGTGDKIGSEVIVNTALAGDQFLPQIDTWNDGSFVVVWCDNESSIFARRFNPEGTAIGNPVKISQDSLIKSVYPDVAALNDGSYAVSWRGKANVTDTNAGWQVFNLRVLENLTPICFARGTHIQIGEKSKPVETLSISNQVSTTTDSAAIKWIGYQRRTPEFAQFQDYLPVKISAGALDENLPLRDLYLSPDHAVLVDGHLIHAKALVNGKTIIQMTQWAGDIEYYHLETEAHEIIFAEGVPCETFIDNVSRKRFDNYAEYQALYPNTRMMKELPLPRVKFKRQLPLAIKQRLEARISELDRQHSFI